MYSENQRRVFASPKLDGRGLVKMRLVVASRPMPFFIRRHSVATRGCTMRVEPAFRAELIAAIPHLRAFARSLTHNTIQADDLVQDTLVRAWGKQGQFETGTNFMAWLFTILRNRYYSVQRKRLREVEDVDDSYARKIACAPEQDGHLDYEDFRAALARLVPSQREALILVAAQGIDYDDAARICGVPVGTIKSRVSRGRDRLAQLLSVEGAKDFGPDRVFKAVLEVSPQAFRIQ